MILPSKTQTVLSFWTVSSFEVVFFLIIIIIIFIFLFSLFIDCLCVLLPPHFPVLWINALCGFTSNTQHNYSVHQKIFKWVINLILFNMSTNYCDTCQISDCACICSICLNHQPLNQTPVKKNRKTNSKKINSISCNSCKLWAHPKYTGLTNKQFKKINNTEVKKNKSSLFFKCLKCSIKAVTSAGLNLTASKNTPTLTQEISTQTISNTLESTIS